MKYCCNKDSKTSSGKTGDYNKSTTDKQCSEQLNLKPHEIALCAHSLNVDGKEYQVTPSWWA
jgi:hypothetical protein